MNKSKRLAAAAAAIAAALTLLSLVLSLSAPFAVPASLPSSAQQVQGLMLKSIQGSVWILEGEHMLLQTEISPLSLPLHDRLLLEEGISVDSPEDLAALLEDYSS